MPNMVTSLFFLMTLSAIVSGYIVAVHNLLEIQQSLKQMACLKDMQHFKSVFAVSCEVEK